MGRRPRLTLSVVRRSPFGRHGRAVVAGCCAYEVAAIAPGSPLPTISELVKRQPVLGVCVLALLAQHWYLEDPTVVVVSGVHPGRTTGPS